MTMYTLKATLEEADAIAKGDKQFIFRADSMPNNYKTGCTTSRTGRYTSTRQRAVLFEHTI